VQKEFQYSLLSDPDRVFIAALGAKDPKAGRTKRAHYIFAKGGKLVDKKLPVSPGDRYVVCAKTRLKSITEVSAFAVPDLPLNLSNQLMPRLRKEGEVK
jgi:peroxiredoxin